jgi:hypothetical protein
MESAQLDKNLIAAVSKPPTERYAQSEDEMHKRLGISEKRQALQSALAKEFPHYSALAQPEPLSVLETQALLDDDEAVVAFYTGMDKSYAWTLTKNEGLLDGDSDERQTAE